MIIMISASHCLLTFIVSITASWIAITNAQQIQQYQQQEWSFFKQNPTNKFSPKEMGRFHTDIFEQFGIQYYSKRKDIYKTNKKQKEGDFAELMKKSFCDNDKQDNKNSIQCSQKIDFIQTQAKDWISTQDPNSGRIEFEYPAFMEESLQVKLEEIFEVLLILDENNLDEVLETMRVTLEDIEAMSKVNALSKFVAISSVSVAMESTKLWHGVFFDEREILRDICGTQGLTTLLTLPFVISADVIFPLVFLFVWTVTFPFILVSYPFECLFEVDRFPLKMLCLILYPLTPLVFPVFTPLNPLALAMYIKAAAFASSEACNKIE